MFPAAKIRYLLWAALRFAGADTVCPACGELRTGLVKRKYGVTALYRCAQCEVMFRVPKPSPEAEEKFYQSDYTQGFGTECPSDDELARLKQDCFAGSERDYLNYIAVLRAAGVEPGESIHDFGCSWGYGSWQLRQAGYKVYSYELSRPRARYAAEKLDCELWVPNKLPGKVDCFFSAHVIEHLTNPREMWEQARNAIKPGGTVILFLPNGDPSLAQINPNYHQLWGQVHPLLLSPLALSRMGEHYGFSVRCYTSPYDLREIAEGAVDKLTGDELLVVGTLLAE